VTPTRATVSRHAPDDALASLRRVLDSVAPGDDRDVAPVIATIIDDLRGRHDALLRADAAMPDALRDHIAAAIVARESVLAGAPPAQRLLEVELGIALFAALARLAATDAALEHA
jgi:hypothetical protein